MAAGEHIHGGNIFEVARSLGLGADAIIDFSASINPLGPAPGVREGLAAAFDKLLHYPDISSAELVEALAAYHGVPCDHLAVANGSTELIHLVPRLVTGRRALVVAPAFAEYASALDRCGWECEYFTLSADTGFALDLGELERALARGYQLIFICNPGNPTGALLDRNTIAQVLELCRASGTFAVVDEAFIDFCEGESAKEIVKDWEGAILLRSMTKFFAIPGLRLGYAIGTQRTIAALKRLQLPWSVNCAAQVAGIASLADAEYREKTRVVVAAERAALAQGLQELDWLTVFPSAANYLLARIDDGRSAAQVRERLIRAGIIIRDCSNFHGMDSRFFRVAVRSRPENERLLHALGALG